MSSEQSPGPSAVAGLTVSPRVSLRVSLWVTAVAAVAFVVLALWRVPWAWVPGGHVAHVDPSSLFSTTQLHRARAYSSLQRHLAWASLAVSTALSLALGFTRAGAWVAGRVRGPWWWRVPVVALVLVVLGVLVTLPFGFALRRNALHYGLTRQPLSGWVRDQATSTLVSWVLVAVLLLVVIGLARLSPRRWPAYAAAAGVALTVLGSFVYPVVVEPLFNSFTSLPQGALRTDILRLARVEGVPISDVLVADASRRTTTLNAYVSGFGSTRRVVLYDNLVAGEPRRVTLSVVAHELGHARHQDVVLGTALGAAGAAAGLGLLGVVLGRRRLLDRVGVRSAGAPEVVALVLALSTLGTLVADPVENTISRAIEARADRAAIESTHDYAAFVQVQQQLAVRSLADPTPPAWSQFWFGSHPTSLERVGIAEALRAQVR